MTRKSLENLKATQRAILLNQEGLCEFLPKTIHEKEEEDELEEDDESLKEEIEEEEPLPTPIKKKKPKVVKRVMTEAQKENLVKARAPLQSRNTLLGGCTRGVHRVFLQVHPGYTPMVFTHPVYTPGTSGAYPRCIQGVLV